MNNPVSLEDQRKIDENRDRQLAARGALGAFVYPIVYCLVAYPTELNQRHPQIHALIIAVFLILATARMAICLQFSRLYSKNRTLWRTSFIASVAGLGTLWGLVSAYAVIEEPWAPSTLLLLFAGSGLSGGMIATIAIDRVAYRVYLLGILIPPGIAAVTSPGKHGEVLAAFHALYFLFLWVQGRRQADGFRSSAFNHLKVKEQRDQLESAMLKAENASLAKSRLLANVSHELRTPLNAILGVTEWSLEDPSRDTLESWQEVHNASLQLLTIIEQILDFSKIDSGHYSQAKSEPFRLHHTVRQVEQLFARSAREKQIGLVVTGIEDPELTLLGDEGRLRQVLCNLVGNAIKFTEAGRVEIDIRYLPNRLEVRIQDTGPGIPEHYRPYIFEPFSQADNSLTRRHGGTGLGLTISQDLVRSMGGELILELSNSRGSRFCLKLPLPVAPSNPTLKTKPKSKPYRVLVVDDDSTNRQVAERQLKQIGLIPTLAQGPREAVERACQIKFDFILMDLQMPETDGYAVTRIILSQEESLNRNTPIIALTAHTGDEEIAQCLAVGMISFLNKPLRKSEILAEISKLEEGGFLRDPSQYGPRSS